MNASKTNIKFNYLYRDAANYKNFGCVIFSNPTNIPIERLRTSINTYLIDGEFFNHESIKIPSLFFYPKNSDDHSWHEFENIEETGDAPTDTRTIGEFLTTFSYRDSAAV